MGNVAPVIGMAASELKPKTVWITGANGLIGTQLVQAAPQFAPDWQVHALTRDRFDLLDFAAVRRNFAQDRPQCIIHCAAITIVADAEKDPGLAQRTNVDVTRLLAELAADIPLVLFSTDLVFDGQKGNYSETDTPNPLQVYGRTKFAAEQIVLANPRHTVVRTSLNYGTSRNGLRAFNEELLHKLSTTGQGMKLFMDEFRCPIPAVETARVVWELVQKNCTGLYHVAGAKRLSRLDIGRLLVRNRPELQSKVTTGSAKDFPGPPRALDTSLDISKVQKVLSRPLSGLDDWLTRNSH